jgi:hypothetical protein
MRMSKNVYIVFFYLFINVYINFTSIFSVIAYGLYNCFSAVAHVDLVVYSFLLSHRSPKVLSDDLHSTLRLNWRELLQLNVSMIKDVHTNSTSLAPNFVV